MSRMLVIYVLYFATGLNVLAALLCSSNSTSNPCVNLCVWNLWVCHLELVFEDRRLLCEVHISSRMFIYVAKFGLESNIPSQLYGIGACCCTSSKFGSTFYICSSASSWIWDCGSLSGHLCCSCPYNPFFWFGEIYGLMFDLGDIDFSYGLYYYYCYFFSNFVTCWGLTLFLIVDSSCFFYLFPFPPLHEIGTWKLFFWLSLFSSPTFIPHQLGNTLNRWWVFQWSWLGLAYSCYRFSIFLTFYFTSFNLLDSF
jgi:hypothetical protein